MNEQDAHHIPSYSVVNLHYKTEKVEKQTNKRETELYIKKIKFPSCWKWLVENWENGTEHI